MNEDEEGDKEIDKAVEDEVVRHTELGKVSPTPAVSLCCVTLHLKKTFFACFTRGEGGKRKTVP